MQNSHHDMHSVEKFTLTEKKFRQINYLVITLVKPVLSRNFLQKCVRGVTENFRHFHTVNRIILLMYTFLTKQRFLLKS